MITALQSNTGFAAANSALATANKQLSAQRVFYGNGLQRLQSATSFLNQEKVEPSTQENGLVGADLATASTNLAQAQTASNAVLNAANHILDRNTLFHYL